MITGNDAQFELKTHRNVRITRDLPEPQGWLVVEGDLVQDSNGRFSLFVPLTYYSGTEEGEAWTEGEHAKSGSLSAQPGGTYSLKLEVEKENPTVTGPLTVRIEQGSAHAQMWFLAFIGILAIPIGVGIYHFIFNAKRWENSSIEPPENDTGPAIELVRAKYMMPPLAIDEPIPMADEVGPRARPGRGPWPAP